MAVVFLAALSAQWWWCYSICQEFFSRCLHGTLNILFEIPYISNSLVLFLSGCLYIDLWVSFADLIAQTSLFPGCHSPLFFSFESVLSKGFLYLSRSWSQVFLLRWVKILSFVWMAWNRGYHFVPWHPNVLAHFVFLQLTERHKSILCRLCL